MYLFLNLKGTVLSNIMYNISHDSNKGDLVLQQVFLWLPSYKSKLLKTPQLWITMSTSQKTAMERSKFGSQMNSNHALFCYKVIELFQISESTNKLLSSSSVRNSEGERWFSTLIFCVVLNEYTSWFKNHDFLTTKSNLNNKWLKVIINILPTAYIKL